MTYSQSTWSTQMTNSLQNILSERNKVTLGKTFFPQRSGEELSYTLMRWKGKFKPKSASMVDSATGKLMRRENLIQIELAQKGKETLFKGTIEEKDDDAPECILIWTGDEWTLEKIQKLQYSHVEKIAADSTPLFQKQMVYPETKNEGKRERVPDNEGPDFKKPRKIEAKPKSISKPIQPRNTNSIPEQNPKHQVSMPVVQQPNIQDHNGMGSSPIGMTMGVVDSSDSDSVEYSDADDESSSDSESD